MKTCVKCSETKEYEAFRRDARIADGRRNTCKDCEKKRQEANAMRICQWCNTEIPPAQKASRLARVTGARTYLYHPSCLGKYLKTLKQVTTLLG